MDKWKKIGLKCNTISTDWEKSAEVDVKWFTAEAIKQRSKTEEYDLNIRIKKEVEVMMDRCKNYFLKQWKLSCGSI